MAIGYRAVLQLEESQSAIAVAEDQVRVWLRAKNRNRPSDQIPVDWDGPGHYVFRKGLELLVVHADHDESTPRRLFRVIDENPAGQWVVTVYAGIVVSKRGKFQTIVVEVDLVGAEREVALEKVAPPAIVRSLLDTYNASDGSVRLTGAPNVIRFGDTDDVISAITDANRTASVVVALSPATDLDDPWRQVVASLTRESVGVTAVYVVYHQANTTFNADLPVSYRIRPGEIRTYLPEVDLNDPSDSIRHRWLALPTLTRSLENRRVAGPLQRRHGASARRRFVETRLPSDVQRMLELLRRQETKIERAARVEELVAKTRAEKSHAVLPFSDDVPDVTGQSSSSWRSNILPTFKRWLGREPAEPQDLQALDTYIEARNAEVSVAAEQLSEAASQVEALQAEIGSLRRERDDMELEWAIALESFQEVDRESTVLRHRLAASAQPTKAYVAPDTKDWTPPGSVEQLLRRLSPGVDAHHAISRVEFTGVEDGAIEIDRRYPTGVYANAFWLHVRVLHDYAVARTNGFSGGVHLYLDSDIVDGAKCPKGQHAAKESPTVLANPKWSAERVFPVPQEVSRNEQILMEGHFKPTWRDTFAPRLYYLDDFANTGKMYIGYIGRHLTNTQT